MNDNARASNTEATISEFRQRIVIAWHKREALHKDKTTNVYRVFHGHSDGLPGLNIDRYANVLIANYELPIDDLVEVLVDAYSRIVDNTISDLKIVAKAHRKLDLPYAERFQLSDANTPKTIEVIESEVRYHIEVFASHSPGLFLDAKPAREWLRQNENCLDKRVMNLFAYTGSLGLCAKIGGAKSVLHLDKSKEAMRGCEINYALNHIPWDGRDYFVGDIYKHLPKMIKRMNAETGQKAFNKQYDGIILDPPPRVHKSRSMQHQPQAQDFDFIVTDVVQLLRQGGWLMCLFHRFGKPREEFEAQVIEAVEDKLAVEHQGLCGDDFFEEDEKNRLKWTVFRKQ